MTATKKLKSKSEALQVFVHTRDDVIAAIKQLGDLLRERNKIEIAMNDQIALLQHQAADEIAPFDEKISELEAAIGAYCTANRDVLTDGNKVKFADLITGKIYWRNNPPRVVVRGTDAVIALLEQSEALSRFVRIKKEVNKEAVLNEAELFNTDPVPGLSISVGKEFFVIEPYNQELA